MSPVRQSRTAHNYGLVSVAGIVAIVVLTALSRQGLIGDDVLTYAGSALIALMLGAGIGLAAAVFRHGRPEDPDPGATGE